MHHVVFPLVRSNERKWYAKCNVKLKRNCGREVEVFVRNGLGTYSAGRLANFRMSAVLLDYLNKETFNRDLQADKAEIF